MIDTLKFYTSDFIINDVSSLKLGIKNNLTINDFINKNTDDFIFRLGVFDDKIKDKEVLHFLVNNMVNKLYYNNEFWNIDIKIFNSELILFVKVDLPAYYKKSRENILPINKDILPDLLKNLINDIKNKTKVEILNDNLKLSRIDLFKNIITKGIYQDYIPLFAILKREGYTNKRVNFDNGFYTGNSSVEICIYDKVKNQINKKYGINEELKGKNILRDEVRLLKSRKIKDYLGNNIIIFDLRNKWDKLKEIYIKENNKLFNMNNIDNERRVFIKNDIQFLLKLRNEKKNIERFFSIKGIKEIILKYETIDNFINKVVKPIYSRKQTYLIKLKLKDMLKDSLEYEKIKEISLKELYEELKNKVLC